MPYWYSATVSPLMFTHLATVIPNTFNKWTHWLIFTTETTTCDDCLLVLVSLFTWVLMASKLPNTWLLPLPLTFWYLLQNHLFGTSPNLVLLLFVMVSYTINPLQYHTVIMWTLLIFNCPLHVSYMKPVSLFLQITSVHCDQHFVKSSSYVLGLFGFCSTLPIVSLTLLPSSLPSLLSLCFAYLCRLETPYLGNPTLPILHPLRHPTQSFPHIPATTTGWTDE